MKTTSVTLLTILIFSFTNAQDSKQVKNNGQTAEEKWLIEVNTAFGTPIGAATGINYASQNGDSVYNFGAEAGYFFIDNLALKVGLGYGGVKTDFIDTTIFSYKIGAKYYIVHQFPIQVDFSGASIKDASENPSYLGMQAGYAWFLGDNVSIEPGVRYNLSLNQNYAKADTFQLNIGFALHF
ncbi:MAG: hypothetical protein RLZZ323_663 [Bacteroidota bacterium]|jgi:hypothetical protein